MQQSHWCGVDSAMPFYRGWMGISQLAVTKRKHGSQTWIQDRGHERDEEARLFRTVNHQIPQDAHHHTARPSLVQTRTLHCGGTINKQACGATVHRVCVQPGKPTVWGGRRVTFAWSTLLRRKPTNYSQSAGDAVPGRSTWDTEERELSMCSQPSR